MFHYSPKLILKPASKITYPPFPITSHVRHFPNMIKHVARSKQQNRNNRHSSPEIAVLDYWEDVRSGDGEESDETKDGGGDGGDFEVVEGSDERRVGAGGQLAGEPGVDWVCGVDASHEIEASGRCIGCCVRSYCWVEEKEDRGGLELQLHSTVSTPKSSF